MTKAISRFFIVFLLALVLGFGIYLAMHFVLQPVAAMLGHDGPPQLIPRTAEPVTMPEFRGLARGVLSMGKDFIVFLGMLVVVQFGFFVSNKLFKNNK